MKIERVFFISKSKISFFLVFKDFIKNIIKFYEIFLVKIKNFQYQLRKIDIKSNNIYVITDENLRDYQVNISKISQIYRSNKLIYPVNKNQNLCDSLQVDISNGSEIYDYSKISIDFDIYINDVRSQKKRYELNFKKKDLKNLVKTKKWLKIIINLPDVVNLKKNKVFIKFRKIDFYKNLKDRSLKFITLKTLSKKNFSCPKVILIVLDGITSNDLFYYSYKLSTTKVFKNLIKDSKSYKNLITASTVTAASIPSLLTNTNLLQHNLFSYESHLLKNTSFPSKNLKFISEEFLEREYNTYALTHFSRMRPHFGMNIGFHEYTNICSDNFHSSNYYEKAMEILKLSRDEKTFIFFHYAGGHPPFYPEIYCYKNKIDNLEKDFYFTNIAKSELFIENIVNYLKCNSIYDDTTLIITSDHGRSLSNFNKYQYHFNQDRLNVPLIYKPRKKNKKKILNNFDFKRNVCYSEIYKLINDYEGINLNKTFQVNPKKEILWTTIAPDYYEKNFFYFIGYSKLFKWVFKCIIKSKILIISEEIKVFKILTPTYIDENKNFYKFIDHKIIKKIKLSLIDFIKESQNKSFKVEKIFDNFLV
jgi:hypothetical protein